MPAAARGHGQQRVFRIGAGAGFSGDRIEPAIDLAERGELDALVFECLAERTIALAQLRRRENPDAGFDPLLKERMRAVLPACVRNGVTIITNMGAANPLAAGHAVLAVARELQLDRLRVAVVTGDDVLPWLQHAAQAHCNERGQVIHTTHDVNDLTPSSDVNGLALVPEVAADRIVSANAYLGAEALLPALQAGADIIITGRVADPALFLAPLMHHFNWPADDWVRLGRGLAVGHLLECAAQVCGGYIAEPGRFDVPDLATLGFPLAEVDAEGHAVISKLAGTGGRVDRLTCTAQLLYEIEDPARYLQPDVVGDFSAVHLTQVGTERVAVSGASGSARPQDLKVSVGYLDGYIGEGQISYGGPGARQRGELALQVLRQRLAASGLNLNDNDVRAELIGVNSLHVSATPADTSLMSSSSSMPSTISTRSSAGAASLSSPSSKSSSFSTQSLAASKSTSSPSLMNSSPSLPLPSASGEPYEVRVRLAARCATRAQAERIGHEVEALYLNGPGAGGGATRSVREVLAVSSCLVPREAVQPAVQMLEWVR